MNKKMGTWFFSAALIGTMASPVMAADINTDGHFVVGGSVGIAQSDFDVLDSSDDEPLFEVFSRYQLDNGFALDFSYIYMGNHENEDAYGTEVDVSGYTLQVGYFWQVSDLITLSAKGGSFFWDTQAYRLVGSGSGLNDIVVSEQKVYDETGTDFTYGIGIDFNVAEHVSVGGNIQHYDMDDNAMNAYTVNAAYHF